MVKRFLTVIFILLYVSASTGITLNLHRCMGKLVEIEIWQNETCASCGAQKQMQTHNCCSTESQLVKISSDQLVDQIQILKQAPVLIALLFNVHDLYILSETNRTTIPGFYYNPPPECSGTELLIQNCTLLI